MPSNKKGSESGRYEKGGVLPHGVLADETRAKLGDLGLEGDVLALKALNLLLERDPLAKLGAKVEDGVAEAVVHDERVVDGEGRVGDGRGDEAVVTRADASLALVVKEVLVALMLVKATELLGEGADLDVEAVDFLVEVAGVGGGVLKLISELGVGVRELADGGRESGVGLRELLELVLEATSALVGAGERGGDRFELVSALIGSGELLLEVLNGEVDLTGNSGRGNLRELVARHVDDGWWLGGDCSDCRVVCGRCMSVQEVVGGCLLESVSEFGVERKRRREKAGRTERRSEGVYMHKRSCSLVLQHACEVSCEMKLASYA